MVNLEEIIFMRDLTTAQGKTLYDGIFSAEIIDYYQIPDITKFIKIIIILRVYNSLWARVYQPTADLNSINPQTVIKCYLISYGVTCCQHVESSSRFLLCRYKSTATQISTLSRV